MNVQRNATSRRTLFAEFVVTLGIWLETVGIAQKEWIGETIVLEPQVMRWTANMMFDSPVVIPLL